MNKIFKILENSLNDIIYFLLNITSLYVIKYIIISEFNLINIKIKLRLKFWYYNFN
jgi:hypothetical protein